MRRRFVVGVLLTAATLVGCGPAGSSPIEAVNARQAVFAAGSSSQEQCRLPVTTLTDNGFLSYPAGAFYADPAGEPVLPGTGGANVTNYGFAYSTLISRWVPVAPSLVSPDGTRYVYGDLHVVDVQSGVESVLDAATSHQWHPVAWEPEGIYAVTVTSKGWAPGLWLVSYPAGVARQISPDGYWQGVSHGAAYGLLESAPPHDASVPIARLEVATGAITKWFYLAGSRTPWLAGFDESGAPVIQQSVDVYVVPAALQPILLAPNTKTTTALGDRWGLWLGSNDGAFLFAGGILTRFSDVHALPVGTCTPEPASTPGSSPPSTPRTYTVRPGDSLSSIARANGLSSYLPLFWRNESRPQPDGGVLTNPNVIRPGWVLEIPTEPLPTYVVQAGDSLSSIAEHFYGPGHGGWWHGIYDANRDQLNHPALIHPGQKLRIP